jgi:hypothetical protein
MSQAPFAVASKPSVARPGPSSRPTLVDYSLIVLGFALSSVLYAVLPHPMVEPGANAMRPPLPELLGTLPALLRLPQGVVLLWPLFLAIQRLMGRKQGLTVVEWLWVFAWLGTALLTGLAAWGRWGSVPEFLHEHWSYPALVWYVILVPSLALIALVGALFSAFGGGQRPWTHNLAIVLLVWPVAPLSGFLALGTNIVWMNLGQP